MVRHFTLPSRERLLLGILLCLAVQGPAMGEEIRGTVKQVDLDKAAEVKVLVPAGAGKLADVMPGQIVDCAFGFNLDKFVAVYVWEK